MERTSRGGGRVWTNLNESHEMRRNGEKFSWDLKVLKIPRGEINPARFLTNKCQCCYYLNWLAGNFENLNHKFFWQKISADFVQINRTV